MAFSPTSSRFWETSLSRLPPSEDLFANLQEDIDLKDYEVTLTCSCTIANNSEYQQIPSMVKKSNKLDTCLELTYIEGRHVCHSHRLYWHFQSHVAVSQTFLKVFRQKHRKDQHEDSLSYSQRFQLYQKRKAFVEEHNSKQGITWTAAVNVFADYTDAEFKALLGHRRLGKWWANRGAHRGASLHQAAVVRRQEAELVTAVDWRQNLVSTNYVKQQGACGSCWAVAAAGALEIHAEIAMKQHKKHSDKVPRNVSFKQLVDCTPNPEHCGGDGGCEGATSELAFEYASKHGLHDSQHYSGDINRDEHCKASSKKSPPYLQLGSYVRLETNKLKPLMEALANVGPVSVSVDAADWNMYGGGIFNDCQKDSIVNHAVLAVGYGHDPKSGLNYWLIRNSWGRDWGEDGFVRLQRHNADDANWDAGYCGFDTDPKQGTGCDGGPSTIPVCGMCGVLSDSSYPKDVTVTEN